MAVQNNMRRSQPGKYKIILVPPVLNLFYKSHFYDNFPLGLFSLTSGLRSSGFNPEIYFPSKRLIREEDYLFVASEILESNPMLVGFSTWCITYPVSLIIARKIKNLKPDVTIVFGGPQASILGKETLQEFSYVDYVLTGECDYTFPEFLNQLMQGSLKSSLSSISGLVYRSDSGSILQNDPSPPIQDLDALPVPAYDLAILPNYLSLEVGRGCPFKCNYCTTRNFFSNTYRTKSADRILNEMEQAYNQYKICRFSFTHDMFTLNNSFVRELCNKLINFNHQQNRSFRWNCSARVDTVSEKLLKLMKEAGCREIFFGIETGSEKIQKSTGKGLDIAEAMRITEISAKLGMEVYASFILGFPDEDEDDIEKTLKCILHMATRGINPQVSELALLPGTPLYKQHFGKLKYDGRCSDFADCLCSFEEIQLIIRYPEIFSSFYYLPLKTLSRDELYYLQLLINHLGDFINTLFLLHDHLCADITKYAILTAFRRHLVEMNSHTEKGAPLITYIVKKLKDYIISNRLPETNPVISDVFSFESARALMLARFARWQLVRPGAGTMKKRGSYTGKPSSMVVTPTWTLLSTGYRLKSILPSENRWRTIHPGVKKEVYHYVVSAASERECHYYEINDKEYPVLKKLATDLSFENLLQMSGFKPDIVVDSFWKKMSERGVVEIC